MSDEVRSLPFVNLFTGVPDISAKPNFCRIGYSEKQGGE